MSEDPNEMDGFPTAPWINNRFFALFNIDDRARPSRPRTGLRRACPALSCLVVEISAMKLQFAWHWRFICTTSREVCISIVWQLAPVPESWASLHWRSLPRCKRHIHSTVIFLKCAWIQRPKWRDIWGKSDAFHTDLSISQVPFNRVQEHAHLPSLCMVCHRMVR
jgi:hypothetical protein